MPHSNFPVAPDMAACLVRGIVPVDCIQHVEKESPQPAGNAGRAPCGSREKASGPTASGGFLVHTRSQHQSRACRVRLILVYARRHKVAFDKHYAVHPPSFIARSNKRVKGPIPQERKPSLMSLFQLARLHAPTHAQHPTPPSCHFLSLRAFCSRWAACFS